jgi:hypothetical protein
MKKILMATAMLGAAVAMPTSSAVAHRSTQYYCIPPSNAQVTAEGAVSGTDALLAPYTPAGLAAVGRVRPTLGVAGAGELTVTLSARATTQHRHHSHSHTVIVGEGSEQVRSAGCQQLDIKLTHDGRRLLQSSSTLTLDVTGVFEARGRHRARGTANAMVTLS